MKGLKQLIRILQLVDQQGLRSYRSLRGGASLSSFRIVQGIHKKYSTIRTIIDVGANQGQFALAAREFYPTSRIISFEPLEDVCTKYRRNTAKYTNMEVFNMALGSQKGVIDFYKNNHSHASSALPISAEQVAAIPQTSKATMVKVPIDRLDHVLSVEQMQSPVLLKLDVQGFERNVLEGSSGILHKINYVLIEASFVPMYEGEPLFDEMNDYLKNLGFSIVGPVGFLEGGNGEILQMDFLYRNVSNRVEE